MAVSAFGDKFSAKAIRSNPFAAFAFGALLGWAEKLLPQRFAIAETVHLFPIRVIECGENLVAEQVD